MRCVRAVWYDLAAAIFPSPVGHYFFPVFSSRPLAKEFRSAELYVTLHRKYPLASRLT